MLLAAQSKSLLSRIGGGGLWTPHTISSKAALSTSSSSAGAQAAATAADPAAQEQAAFMDAGTPAEDALLALLDYSMAHPNQQLGGPGGHPVLRLLQARLRDGSAPGGRSDGCKLGLVVEGGGMRGIVTGAMCLGLQDMGMLNVFDAVYGACARAACVLWRGTQGPAATNCV